MLESEPCGCDAIVIIKDDVKRVLFTTNTETLTAFTFDLNVNEQLHLIVETEDGSSRTSTGILPNFTW